MKTNVFSRLNRCILTLASDSTNGDVDLEIFLAMSYINNNVALNSLRKSCVVSHHLSFLIFYK